jgi:inner membrane protein
MKGKNHMVAGACTAGCLVASAIFEGGVGIIPIVGMGAAAAFGSMFPDIDSRTSKLGKKMKITSWLCSKVFGHRGFLHSPLFAALVYLICWMVFDANNIPAQYCYIWGGFIAGMLMHFMCDMATKGGLPLLYPLARYRFGFGILESGSKWEWLSLVFIMVLAVGATILMIANGVWLSKLLPM